MHKMFISKRSFARWGQNLKTENKFPARKMIDIYFVVSGVKYHWLSYWSIVMTSQVEFSPVNFMPNSMKSPSNCITDQEK